jgi:hypothetical protein
MSERTDQITRDGDADDDGGIDPVGGDAVEDADTDAGGRFRGHFSPRAFLGVLVGLAVLAAIGRSVVPFVSGLGGIAGAFVGAFLVGLLSGEARYVETGVAAALLGAVSAVPGVMAFGFGLNSLAKIAAVGAGIGLVVALVGVYFGRDLRAGVTKDV